MRDTAGMLADSTDPSRLTTRRSIRVGLGLFVVGLVFLAATVVPFFFGDHNRSLWINLGCMLAPTGFVVIIVGAVRQGRELQRSVLEQLAADAR